MDDWQLVAETTAAWGVPLAAASLEAMRTFYELLVEGNRRANLTRITAPREAVVKHFLDALSVLVVLEQGRQESPLRLLDVGAGAGIPGIPLLLARPHWRGTLLEATGKKVAFMEEAIAALHVTAQAQHARAEDWAQQPGERGAYDLVVARAVAELNVLCELCLPFLKVGGVFVAMKGSQVEDEVERARKAIALLGAEISEVRRLELPEGYGSRALVVISQRTLAPKIYPRRAGIPAAKPLC